MKRLLAILLFCLVAALAPAQSQPDDYSARFGQLSRAYAKNPASVEALYDLAQFYFDNAHPMRSLPMAMDYIQRAEEEHIKLLEKNKIKELTRLGRKGIDLTSLRQMKQAVLSAARNTVALRTDMGTDEIDRYLASFASDAELVRQLRQRRLRAVYDEALADGSVDACYRFMTAFPGTAEAARMEERLRASAPSLFASVATEAAADTLAARYPQSPSIKQEAARCKSRLAFAEAERQGTAEAYGRYLERYATGSESQQARERLDALVEADLERRHSALDLARFAETHADLPLADEALERMRRLIYARHDAQAAQYYVDHFPLDPYRSEVYGRYYSWCAVEGNVAPLRRFADANPDFPYPSALEDDLEHAAEIDTLPLNEPFREADLLRYSDYVRRLMGKAIAIVPLQRMLQPLLGVRNYRAALDRVRQFEICFDNQWQSQYSDLVALLSTPNAARVTQRELADSVALDHPVVNPADGRLYYTRHTPAGSVIACAVRQGTVWKPAGDVLFSNAAATDLTLYNFYADGSRMLLGSGGDIWIAERDGDQWRVSDIPPYPVNTDYIETDAYMLPDGSGMLLASDRPGGRNLQPSGSWFHGDTALATDLWFIPYSRQRWGEPVNLGLNTPYAEGSPVLSRNLRTLYFVSDGYHGLGYADLYMAERTSTDDWEHWSTPRNAGRECNTPLRESSVSFSPDERRLYLASGGTLVSLPAWHDNGVSYGTFNVKVAGLEPYLFRVRVVDLDQQAVAYTVEYAGQGSNVAVNVRRDGRYLLLADAGSRFVPAVPVDTALSGVTLLQGFTLRQLVASDRALTLYAVAFDSTAALTPVARMQLDQLALFLERNPEGLVEFCVDVAGADVADCYRRSLERCAALRDYLAARGIAATRVILSPYGNVNAGIAGHDAVAVRFRE